MKVSIIWKRSIKTLRSDFHASFANEMRLGFRWHRVNTLSKSGCGEQNILSVAVLLQLGVIHRHLIASFGSCWNAKAA